MAMQQPLLGIVDLLPPMAHVVAMMDGTTEQVGGQGFIWLEAAEVGFAVGEVEEGEVGEFDGGGGGVFLPVRVNRHQLHSCTPPSRSASMAMRTLRVVVAPV